MTIMQWTKKTVDALSCRLLQGTVLVMLLLDSVWQRAFASGDPFGDMNITPSQLTGKAGTATNHILRYILTFIGVMMIGAGALNVMKAMNRTAEEKNEHGNTLKTIFVIIFCILIGFVLIALGWKGTNANYAGNN